MGNYSSIEELKSDTIVLDKIKSAIKATYEIENSYKISIKNVDSVKLRSDVIGSNKVETGRGVATSDDTIKISQSTNLMSVLKTVHAVKYLTKMRDPIVKFIVCDMMDLSKGDCLESAMKDPYDPKWILEILGVEGKGEYRFDIKWTEPNNIPSDKDIWKDEIIDTSSNVIEHQGFIFKTNAAFANSILTRYPSAVELDKTSEYIINDPDIESYERFTMLSTKDLFSIITSDYLTKADTIITNAREYANTIENNIRISTYNYAINEVIITGSFVGSFEINQSNEAIQLLYDNISAAANDIAKIKFIHTIKPDQSVISNNIMNKLSQQMMLQEIESDETNNSRRKILILIIMIGLMSTSILLLYFIYLGNGSRAVDFTKKEI